MPIKIKRSKKSVLRRPKKYVKKPVKSLTALIKKITLKTSETKFGSQNAENQQLYHNGGTAGTYNQIQNMLQTAQSGTQNGREGDRINAKGISIHLWLSNKLDRPNVMYRIVVYTCPFDQYTVASPSGFFQGLHANKMIDYINTDKYKLIYTKTIQPFSGDYSLESGATNKEHSRQIKIYIPLKNRTITYGTDGGVIPNNQNSILCMGIIAYDSFGSLTTDNIASFSYVTKFYFKDP